jgi:hypothetical protein
VGGFFRLKNIMELDPKRKGLTSEEMEAAWEKSHQLNGTGVRITVTENGERVISTEEGTINPNIDSGSEKSLSASA